MSNPATKITMSTQYFSQMDLSLRFIVWERFTLGLSVDLDFIVQKSSKKQGKGKVHFFFSFKVRIIFLYLYLSFTFNF